MPTQQAIPITREEYAAKFGQPPEPVQAIPITREQYRQKFGHDALLDFMAQAPEESLYANAPTMSAEVLQAPGKYYDASLATKIGVNLKRGAEAASMRGIEFLQNLGDYTRTESPEYVKKSRELHQAIRDDWAQNPIDPSQRGVLGFLEKGILDATNVAPAMVGGMATAAATGPAASLLYWTSQIQPEREREMVQDGIPPETASRASMVGALPEAAIEMMQVKGLTPKSMDTLREAGRVTLRRYFANYAKGYAQENIEEAAQDAVGILNKGMAAWLDKEAPGVDWNKELDGFWQGRKDTAGAMIFLQAPGATIDAIRSQQFNAQLPQAPVDGTPAQAPVAQQVAEVAPQPAVTPIAEQPAVQAPVAPQAAPVAPQAAPQAAQQAAEPPPPTPEQAQQAIPITREEYAAKFGQPAEVQEGVPDAEEVGTPVEAPGQAQAPQQEPGGGIRVRDDAQDQVEAQAGEVEPKNPWQMTQGEQATLRGEMDKLVQPNHNGEQYLDADTPDDVLDALEALNPNIVLSIKDSKGHRAWIPIKAFRKLSKIGAAADRFRTVKIAHPSDPPTFQPSGEFLGIPSAQWESMAKLGSLPQIEGPVGAEPTLTSVEPIPGIELVNNSFVRADRMNSFQDAVRDERVRRDLQALGIERVEIVAPGKLSLSEMGHIDVKKHTIRLSADAVDPTNTMLHELGHVVYDVLSEGQRAAWNRIFPSIETGERADPNDLESWILKGYQGLRKPIEGFAETYAHQGEPWADAALAIIGEQDTQTPQKAQAGEVKQPDPVRAAMEAADAEAQKGQTMAGGFGLALGGKARLPRADEYAQAQQGRLKSVDPQVEEEMLAAHGIKKESLGAKIKRRAQEFGRKATRQFEHIPNTGEWASANELLRLLKGRMAAKSDLTIREVGGIVDPLSPGQFADFERILILHDMAEGLNRGENIAFTASRDVIAQDLAAAQALMAEDPGLAQAIQTRQVLAESVTKELEQEGLIPEGVDREWYYHRQVLEYHNAAKAGRKLSGGQKVRPTKRSFQRKRERNDLSKQSEYAYNTDYFQSEIEWITEARMEIEKKRTFMEIDRLFGIGDKLKAKAKQKGVPVEDIDLPEGYSWIQLNEGNFWYPALTVSEKLAEQLVSNTLEELGTSPKGALAMGRRKPEYCLPTPVAEQILSMEKPRVPSGMRELQEGMIASFKTWTLFGPHRVVGYTIRNVTGDIDPAIAAEPLLLKRVPESLKMLYNYYYGDQLAIPEPLEVGLQLDVIGSSRAAADVPAIADIKMLKRFYRLHKTNQVANIPKKYFDEAKRFNEFREGALRLAAFLHYRDKIRAGELEFYGGAKKEVVQALVRELGPDVAAAHLARNLFGDYRAMTVMGEYMANELAPFYRWFEVSHKRTGRLLVNANEYGKDKAAQRKTMAGKAVARAAYTTYALSGIAAMYAMFYAWNHLKHPDEEKDLSPGDQAQPHINLGRNQDGTWRVFRRVGALGDVLETFGVDKAIELYDQFEAGQLSSVDYAEKIVTAPFNKAWQMLRPEIKGGAELLFGRTTYPDVFDPQPARRDEIAAGIVGMREEYRKARGALADSGTTPGKHYFQRKAFGVVEPGQSALSVTYDLMDAFDAKRGKPKRESYMPEETFANMRRAAEADNYKAFIDARAAYLAKGKTRKDFIDRMEDMDPLTRLSKDDQERFAAFLTEPQKQKVQQARQYRQEIKVRLGTWWLRASEATEQSR